MPTKTKHETFNLLYAIASKHDMNQDYPDATMNNLFVSCDHVMTGGSVPFYKLKIAKVIDATGSYSSTHEGIDFVDGHARVMIKRAIPFGFYDRTILKGNLLASSVKAVPHSLGSSGANLTARTRFWGQVISERQRLLGGAFLGEMGKALSMMRRPAKALFDRLLRHGTRAKKRVGPIKNARARSKVASELWLEGQFGWKPLLMDIKGAAEAAAELSFLRPTRHISGSGQEVRLAADITQITTRGYIDLLHNNKTFEGVRQRFTGVVQLDTGSVASRQLALFGLEWSAVPMTIWELMPFSFLSDYFSNIGDVIANLTTASAPLKWANIGSVSWSTVEHRVLSGKASGLAGGDKELYCLVVPSEIISRWNQFNRSSVQEVEKPSLSFSLPHGLQWLNMAALAQACRF